MTVVDRQPGSALETSFTNAGEISFGYCARWAVPGIPVKALKWMMMKHAPLIRANGWSAPETNQNRANCSPEKGRGIHASYRGERAISRA